MALMQDPVSKRSRRILLVEDDHDVAELLAMCLGALVADAETEHAPDGRQAMALLEAGHRYDLILCDIMMPGLDGARLMREAADRGLLEGQRVAILSAVERERIPAVLAIPNVVAYFQKPLDPTELAERVSELLEAG